VAYLLVFGITFPSQKLFSFDPCVPSSHYNRYRNQLLWWSSIERFERRGFLLAADNSLAIYTKQGTFYKITNHNNQKVLIVLLSLWSCIFYLSWFSINMKMILARCISLMTLYPTGCFEGQCDQYNVIFWKYFSKDKSHKVFVSYKRLKKYCYKSKISWTMTMTFSSTDFI